MEFHFTRFNDYKPPSQFDSLQSSQVLWCSFSFIFAVLIQSNVVRITKGTVILSIPKRFHSETVPDSLWAAYKVVSEVTKHAHEGTLPRLPRTYCDRRVSPLVGWSGEIMDGCLAHRSGRYYSILVESVCSQNRNLECS